MEFQPIKDLTKKKAFAKSFVTFTNTSVDVNAALQSIRENSDSEVVLFKRRKGTGPKWYVVDRKLALDRLAAIVARNQLVFVARGGRPELKLEDVLDELVDEDTTFTITGAKRTSYGANRKPNLFIHAPNWRDHTVALENGRRIKIRLPGEPVKITDVRVDIGASQHQSVDDFLKDIHKEIAKLSYQPSGDEKVDGGSGSGSAGVEEGAAVATSVDETADINRMLSTMPSTEIGTAKQPADTASIIPEPSMEVVGGSTTKRADDISTAAGGPPEEPPVFANIEPKPERVVQGRRLDVDVSLQAEPARNTVGEVRIPGLGPHTLNVHLLLGEQGDWKTLEYSRTAGTTKKAQFHFIAPVIQSRQDGTRPARLVQTLVANFYLNGRWCGEARRNIEVLLHDKLPPSAELPRPEPPLWRKILNIAPGAVPPDLLVRIQAVSEEVYEFTVLSPHSEELQTGARKRTTLRNGPQRFVREKFDKIAGAALTDKQFPLIETRCRDIYRSTPPVFQEAYWKLYHLAQQAAATPAVPGAKVVKLETIQFVSDEPFVPWELMLVSDPARGPDVTEEILSIRHSVGRWAAGASSQLRPVIGVQNIAVFASDYEQVPSVKRKLPWAAKERDLLTGSFGAQSRDLKYKPVLDFFQTGGAQAVHFSCHGSMDAETPEDSALLLEDFQDFTTAYLDSDKTRQGEGREHPLVFLNACQIGGVGAELGLVTGWPQTFLEVGASACIAPLWSVVDANAKEVAALFYDLTFNKGVPLGQALQQIRALWKERKNLTFLSYVLYGDAAARVEWHRAPASSGS
jgi:hypothetical protein